MGLASYILFIGMYSSAISASIDKRINAINPSFYNSKSSISSYITEAEIISHVLKITKRQEEKRKEEVGMESSLSEEETKDYLEKVLLEVKQLKATKK